MPPEAVPTVQPPHGSGVQGRSKTSEWSHHHWHGARIVGNQRVEVRLLAPGTSTDSMQSRGMLTTRSARPIRRHPARAPAESSGQGVRQAKSRCTNRALLQHVGLVLHAAVVGCCDIAVEAEAARPRRRVVRGSRLPARTSGALGSGFHVRAIYSPARSHGGDRARKREAAPCAGGDPTAAVLDPGCLHQPEPVGELRCVPRELVVMGSIDAGGTPLEQPGSHGRGAGKRHRATLARLRR